MKMSKQKEVITITGETLPISKCRKFPKGYYKIGNLNEENSGDCYIIEGNCYRFETGRVIFNYSINEYTMNKGDLVNGVISFENNIPQFGHFSPEGKAEIVLENGNKYFLLDEQILNGNKSYRERLSDGIFYHIQALQANQFNLIKVPSNGYKTSLPYDSKGITEQYDALYNRLYNNKVNSTVKEYAPILGDLTFGLEFETIKGFVPNRILNKFGLIPLRDGSISGIEYVTIPLKGEKGLQTTVDLLDCLKERTVYDKSCSLHLHMGNIPRTKEFILAFFKISCLVQDELYQMFPLYKKYNFGVKNKNYSAPFPVFKLLNAMDSEITKNNINDNFDVLFSYLSHGQSFKDYGCDLNNVQFHPADPNGTQKWNINTRYYIHNFIPLIFGNKATIEFRIHTATCDISKIMNFIIMNAILLNFTMKHQDSILRNRRFLNDFNLREIISNYIYTSSSITRKDALADCIFAYMNKRTSVIEQCNRKGDIIGNEDHIPSYTGIDWTSDNVESTFKIPTDFSFRESRLGRKEKKPNPYYTTPYGQDSLQHLSFLKNSKSFSDISDSIKQGIAYQISDLQIKSS